MAKNWKELILSSGIPLEHSIRKTLNDSGIDPVNEYRYERRNREGNLEVFSIDNHGLYWANEKICLEYFIECKYSRDDKNWIFTPEVFNRRVYFHELYLILDSLVENFKFTQTYVTEKEGLSEFCGKGIVIESNDSNEYEIKRGIQQLRYALAHRTVEVLKKQLFGLVSERDIIPIFIPILVTTAKLWRLEPETTVESIRNCNGLDEIAKEKTFLVLYEQPDNQMSRYNLELIDNIIRPELSGNLSQLLQTVIPRLANKDFSNFVDDFVKNMPKFFLITNYNYFSQGINKSLVFFKNNSSIITSK